MKSNRAWEIIEQSPKMNELFKPYSISNREGDNEVVSIEIDGPETVEWIFELIDKQTQEKLSG